MTRENVKKNIGIISAFAEGKVIQILNERSEWVDLTEREGLPMGTLEECPNIFRIKPESKYRPFEDSEECWQEMLKHQPFGWVTYQCAFFHIIYIEDKLIGYGSACGTILHSKFNDVLKSFTFADGLPFGVEEEK